MDDALVPVVVGGLLAFVAGLIGSMFEARRSHGRWLREKRFEAYAEFIAWEVESRRLADLIAEAVDSGEGAEEPLAGYIATLRGEKAQHIRSFAAANARALLLAPEPLRAKIRKYNEAERAKDDEAIVETLRAVMDDMRQALTSPRAQRSPRAR